MVVQETHEPVSTYQYPSTLTINQNWNLTVTAVEVVYICLYRTKTM
jgi:hypothetical protein